MPKARARVWCTVSMVALGVATAATAADETATDTGNTKLQEVVVTAQRRVENLQNVSIAATALSADALKAKAVTRLDELQFAAPGLSITDAGLTQSVNIRGIGLASGSPNSANGVATYVDGLFQPPIVTSNTFFDIANIEVLRGPQGTLVGSNSTGGAILISSQNPSLSRYGGYVEASAGSYGAFGGQGAVNIPIGDTLAVRVAAIGRERESYYSEPDGPSAYHRAGSLGEKGVRVGVLWKPVDKLQLLGKMEVVDKDTGGYAYRPIPTTLYAPYASADPRTLDYDSPTENAERGHIFSFEARYELPDGITLRSLSGYQNKQIQNLYDSDATDVDLPALGLPQSTEDQMVREREWTEEVNIISPSTGRVTWILGGYYQHNVINVAITDVSAGFPTKIAIENYKQTTGYFAQAGYKITSTLELDAGIRYSAYQVTGPGTVTIGGGLPGFPAGGLPVANIGGAHKDDAVTGKVSLNWKPDGDNLVYVFAARGYKPGGFNSPDNQFAPESVWDYELGWKSTLLGGHLRTQLGAFYNDFQNFQSDVYDAATGQSGYVANVSAVTIMGVEAQVQAKLAGWTFDGGISLLHSKLGSLSFIDIRTLPAGTLGPQCPAGVASNPPVCFDYTSYYVTKSGEQNLYSPQVTFNLGAEYTFDLPGSSTLTPRLNYAYVGAQYTNLLESPVTDRLGARGLLSAHLTWRRGSVEVEGYGTNLTNVLYVSGQSANNEFFGAPREFGVRLHYSF